MTFILGPSELRQALRTTLDGLRSHKAQIDEANVFPVPDGDTGTNLVMTVEAVCKALDGVPDRPADVARTVIQASVVGARGNSGVILAQFLRGLCEALEGTGLDDVRRALKRAAELSYQAMTKPREGTMLTVARAAADAAQGGDDLAGILERAASAGLDALAHTPDLLPELAHEGVVDAGGIGLCILLEALAATMSGRVAEPVAVPLPSAPAVRPRESGSLEFAYEVQYLLDASTEHVPALCERLEAIGDSVAVVGGDGLLNVHVHTNDIGHAIEIGVEHGQPHSISVVAFEDQIARTRGLPLAAASTPVATLVLADGEGLKDILEELGATVLKLRSTPEEIAARIDLTAAPDVIVVACASRALISAQQAAAAAHRNVEILDAGNEARAFAALLEFNEAEDFIDNLTAMWAAIAGARAGTAASDDALLDSVRSLGDGEALTVFAGAGVHEDEREAVRESLTQALPALEVEVRSGGQTSARYVFVLE